MKIPGLKTFNRGYRAARVKKILDAKAGGTAGERACIWFKDMQGETFNNIVTAVGTSAVAPIFIIHNPLAKEDKQTKEYTAARQPISAIITLAAQVPIMKAYNNWVDKMAIKHHLDKCDLAAAPRKSYIQQGVEQDYKDFLYKKAIGDKDALKLYEEFKPAKKSNKLLDLYERYKTKQNIKEYFYLERKDQAFYDEKQFLREAVRNNKEPEYLTKSYLGSSDKTLKIEDMLPRQKYIKIEDMISRNDIKNAGKEIIADYMYNKFGVKISDLGLPVNVSLDTIDDFSQLKVKKALKENNIKFTKEHKKELSNIIKNDSAHIARKNVAAHLVREARLKLYSHKVYNEAKQEMQEYRRQLLLDGVPKAEKAKLLAEKDIEILKKLQQKAEAMIATAPEKMQRGSELNKLTIDTVIPTKSELATFIKKIQDKLDASNSCERYIKHLRTSEGTTFKELYKSVQVKRWLTARINNSENYLSDFKQKSGIIVGLAILPFTCGLLNWAYPRIMEEWFPHLANAKKASAAAKEAK